MWVGAPWTGDSPAGSGHPAGYEAAPVTAVRGAGNTLRLSGFFYVFEEEPSVEAATSCPLVGGERK
jgi:hypothetical protein